MRWIVLALALLWPATASSQAPYMSAAFEELGAPGASTARLSWIQRGCVVRIRNEVATPIQCSWGGDITIPLEGRPETAPAGGDIYRLFDGPYLLGEDELPPVYYDWLPVVTK
jgi:hypothetical protein